VIICTSCGKPTSAEMSTCQQCGAPLVAQSSAKPRTNEQEQIPSWLESLKAIERPTPPPGGQPSFSVADIVDPDALPGWMRSDNAFKNADSSKRPAMRPASMAGPNTDSSGVSNISPGSLSASSLIDSSSLPAWLRPQQAEQPSMISASSLIDADQLPGWLTGQTSFPAQAGTSGQSTRPSNVAQGISGQAGNAPYPGPSQPAGESTGIPASSLLDVNALPAWLREEARAGRQSPGTTGTEMGSGSPGLSAGSLIDMEMLPDWLRNVEQGQPGSAGSPGSSSAFGGTGAYGGPAVPPRVENVRVPSRPRAEMAPMEQSEMAANVFSSLLGVASVSPSYPASGSDYPAQQPLQATPQMPPFPASQAQQTPGTNQQFPGQQGGIPSPLLYPGMPPASPPQGNMTTMPGGTYPPAMQQAGLPGQERQNAYGIAPGLAASPAGSPVPPSPQGGQQRDQQAGGTTGTKSDERSFLETIRGWFHF
jgi:hypothetical protein